MSSMTGEEAERYFNAGARYVSMGDWARAKMALEKAVELAPTSSNSLFLLGLSLLKLGDTHGAVEPLSRCVELNPKHADGHNALGMALGRLERYDEADRHVAIAAFLGHPQAPQTLATMDMDFCRQCAAPVKYGRDPGADIVFVGDPNIGWRCSACDTVFCSQCMEKAGMLNVPSPRCPRCNGRILAILK